VKLRGKTLNWATVVLLTPIACSSAPQSLPETDGSMPDEPLGPAPVYEEAPIGWASVADLGLTGTTGGLGAEVVTATTTAEFKLYVDDMPGPRTVLVSGVIGDGTRISIGSNMTVIGLPGAEYHGGLRVDGTTNVIVRNLAVIGNNCSDNDPARPDDCSTGSDAFSIGDGAHHVWVDHCDVSDGSDGNLDINDRADYITISWTKFHYSGSRAGGHQFSNLIGSGDNNVQDTGHLRVTWHHNWWAENIHERMPRVRYGAVHIFNNLYTAAGNSYCVGVGFFANILTERNLFMGVRDPIQSSDYSNDASIVVSHENVYLDTTGDTADRGTNVFSPPYSYTMNLGSEVRPLVQNGAGVCRAPYVFSAEPPTCSDPPPAEPTAL
jgi:pectate lyase